MAAKLNDPKRLNMGTGSNPIEVIGAGCGADIPLVTQRTEVGQPAQAATVPAKIKLEDNLIPNIVNPER